MSDRKLMEQLNGNVEWQFFCGIYLKEQRLTNYKIISEIRSELASKLDIEKLQKVLMSYPVAVYKESGSYNSRCHLL